MGRMKKGFNGFYGSLLPIKGSISFYLQCIHPNLVHKTIELELISDDKINNV